MSDPERRRPLDAPHGVGGDAVLSFLGQTQVPTRVPRDAARIRGLNVETIVLIVLYYPGWLLTPTYAVLLPDGHRHAISAALPFSLNLSIFNGGLIPEEWVDQWFQLSGKVHPYALTWEVEQNDGLEEEVGQILDLTIPAIQIREGGCQAISPRLLDGVDDFPNTSPTLSFSGIIAGSGQTLLRKEALPTFDDVQFKCCAFIQLSTFINPTDPAATPYRGYHPYQVFIIFPIYSNPYPSLCKKMIDKPDSSFVSGMHFFCSGKVIGILDHDLMVEPPGMKEDYVFIVVPETWSFIDRSISSQARAGLSRAVPSTQPRATNMRQFMSPSRRATTSGPTGPAGPVTPGPATSSPSTGTSALSLQDHISLSPLTPDASRAGISPTASTRSFAPMEPVSYPSVTKASSSSTTSSPSLTRKRGAPSYDVGGIQRSQRAKTATPSTSSLGNIEGQRSKRSKTVLSSASECSDDELLPVSKGKQPASISRAMPPMETLRPVNSDSDSSLSSADEDEIDNEHNSESGAASTQVADLIHESQSNIEGFDSAAMPPVDAEEEQKPTPESLTKATTRKQQRKRPSLRR